MPTILQQSSTRSQTVRRVGRKKKRNDLSLAIVIHDTRYRGNLLEACSKLQLFKTLTTYSHFEALLKENNSDKPTVLDECIILMDFKAIGSKNTHAVSKLLKVFPNGRIVMLTYSEEESQVLEAIKQGACGYISKRNNLDMICGSVRDVILGNIVIDPKVVKYLAKALRENQQLESQDESELTQRQMDVLRFLSKGLQKKEIADRLNLSYHTVAMHTRMIYDRFNVNNASAAVAKALKLGIL
jgi:DNA-binding NarL/FixJ family response regulator